MHNLSLLEAYFKKFIENIESYLPEDILMVDLELLKELNLLHYQDDEDIDPSLTRYFHVIETDEKITLINDDFVVWIVPEKIEDMTLTYTLIARNEEPSEPRLEVCFVTSGVYNNSKLVLRILEKLMFEIQENERELKALEG